VKAASGAARRDGVLFAGVRALSALGSLLSSFTWGSVLQLDRVSWQGLADLAHRTPLLPGKDAVAFVDIDSTQKRVYWHTKQSAAFGNAKVQGKSLPLRGLSALVATVSTPLGAPVIAATRLRGGSATWDGVPSGSPPRSPRSFPLPANPGNDHPNYTVD
jgi:hypothetical protein